MRTNVQKASSPRIGVSWITHGQEKSERYIDAVSLAGGEPVPLLADVGSWTADLDTISGLLLTGGGDVDPQLYGEENRGLSRGINRQRDDLELEALHFCLDRGLPVLAICRGLQFVNAALGGSLVQDIQSDVPHRPVGEQSSFHEIEVSAGTRLTAVIGGQNRLRVNSRHHQGVDLQRVAPPLRVTALAPDGIVEGLELEGDRFLVAVQCHPEYMGQVPQLTGIFALLVAAARAS